MGQPTVDAEFLADFKRRTERRWSHAKIKPAIYGFQFRPGTRWNAGLTDQQLAEYERAVGVRFPDDFRCMLRAMNGTDTPTVDVRGSSGEPHLESVGVYSHPRDLDIVKSRMDDVRPTRAEVERELADQGYVLEAHAALVPIFAHRYVVCGSDPSDCVVLSSRPLRRRGQRSGFLPRMVPPRGRRLLRETTNVALGLVALGLLPCASRPQFGQFGSAGIPGPLWQSWNRPKSA